MKISTPMLKNDSYRTDGFRWVLSAGHCFCTKTPCKDDGNGNLIVDFVPKDRVACVVGLNDIALLPR